MTASRTLCRAEHFDEAGRIDHRCRRRPHPEDDSHRWWSKGKNLAWRSRDVEMVVLEPHFGATNVIDAYRFIEKVLGPELTAECIAIGCELEWLERQDRDA